MPNFFKRLMWDNSGATALEYGLIAALICLAMLGALVEFGASVEAMWLDISVRVSAAISTAVAI